jgi:hypothetical protein
MPFGNEADKFAVFQHHQPSYVVFGHHFEGVEHRGIRMNAVNVVALLIEYLFYCRHPASPFWPEQRAGRRRANHPSDAIGRLRLQW